MVEELMEDCIEEKLKEDQNYIRFTFYELRIKHNLSEEETEEFLRLAKDKFDNMNYKVYFTDTKYVYKNANMTVQPNELLIAIKENNK